MYSAWYFFAASKDPFCVGRSYKGKTIIARELVRSVLKNNGKSVLVGLYLADCPPFTFKPGPAPDGPHKLTLHKISEEETIRHKTFQDSIFGS